MRSEKYLCPFCENKICDLSRKRYLTYLSGIIGNAYLPLSNVSHVRLEYVMIQGLLNGPTFSHKIFNCDLLLFTFLKENEISF